MKREPAITFRGALQILGHYDRPWLTRLDALLGGAVLAAGGIPAIGALWGWVDQKNEATGLLRRGLDAASNRLTRTGGLERHELVIAAHTTMVLAAFFEALADGLGKSDDETELTEAEKVMLGTGEWQQVSEPLIRHLYKSAVPAPSAVTGFEENVKLLGSWSRDRLEAVVRLLSALNLEQLFSPAEFDRAVTKRYRSSYLRLATTVPEFRIWANLNEHAATRAALSRLETLLTTPALEPAPHDTRVLLAELNRSELTRPVIDVDIDGYGIDAVFPTIERIFLTPHFRSTTATKTARVGDESWWEEIIQEKDLDNVLARHFSTPGATQLPLLLLGHPGAGKSLLTKLLAARLPESTYTVVRVPLRRVNADTHVSTQIQEALTLTTNGRVSWSELVDRSADRIRVILLDGLDELLQATTNDRAGYLTDIVEFQRVEAALGKPVAVVVTSRTLVADRVRVPDGTPVLKLEGFDNNQIAEWLQIWHDVNRNTRPVPIDTVMAQRELARQPLLLLMLVLYFADPETAPPNEDMSTVDLYQRLFHTYARREVTKKAKRLLGEVELAEAVHTQLSRLSIAALGMFNRGRQSVTEEELVRDLDALGQQAPAGERLLGEFFFVHAPEAVAGKTLRGYEFLHATFAEYLVANNVVEVLVDVADGFSGRRRFHEPDDDELFALLSHQPLAIQPRTVHFIDQLLLNMTDEESQRLARTLDLLILAYRHRKVSARFSDYRPMPPDTVRALAAYSANLVMLRILVDPSDKLDPTTLWPDDGGSAWQATVTLWSAGLGAEDYRAILATISMNAAGDILWRDDLFPEFGKAVEVNAARLQGKHELERRLRFGHAVLGEGTYYRHDRPHAWEDYGMSILLDRVLRTSVSASFLTMPESAPVESTSIVAESAYGVLGLKAHLWRMDDLDIFIRGLMKLRIQDPPSAHAFGLVQHVAPGLLDNLRSIAREDWSPEWHAILAAATPDNLPRIDYASVVTYLNAVIPRNWSFEYGEGGAF